ncbi:DNA-processing protein DprA [Desulfocurvus sp.]|uniref:DNA-processing protein DprA n=1 Tax=Desulfocurvus sp. TaxID=2871698 RepID=UPI0025BA143C|nr:DNA-processing protein DprA [Desulfocurvus sp.]
MHEDRLSELRACLALRHSPGIGPHTWRGLLEHYGCAREAVADARSWRGLGLVRADAVRPFLARAWEPGAARELERALDLGLRPLAWADPDYPALLRAIPDPPVLLYCRGDLRLLRGPAVAIVGSRKYAPEGMLAASRIGRELSAAGVTVVSGLAWGIDREAHLAGLTGPGSSVAVLGTGLDRVYPSRNVDVFKRLGEQGLLVTEFAPGTGPEAGNFPVRNRIVSGLSLGVVVAQAAARSGSRITARLALEQGREVYVYPGPEGMPDFEGCRALAEEGALPVAGAEAILADLAPRLRLALERRDTPARPPAGRARHLTLDPDALRPAPRPAQRAEAPAPGPAPRRTRPGAPRATPPAPPAAAAPGGPGAGAGVAPCRPPAAPAPGGPGVSVSGAPGAHAPGAFASGTCGSPAPGAPGARPLPEDADQRAVVLALAGDRRLHIDALGRELGWDAARLSRVLLMLEIGGQVRQWPGMQYSLA